MHEKVKSGFLQACLNHGSLTTDQALKIITPICEAYNEDVPEDPAQLKKFVKELSDGISTYNQTLEFIKHPLVGEEFIVLGFTSESQVAKLQSHYNDTDRHYFFKLLEALVSGDDYGIPWVEVYSVLIIQPGQKQIKKSRMQELVQCWTQQGYFIEKDSNIYFGPRMLIEYCSHLKSNYPNLVKDCPLCNKLVLWDVTCSDCKVKFHRECIRKYLIKKSTCPSCRKTWATRLSLSQ